MNPTELTECSWANTLFNTMPKPLPHKLYRVGRSRTGLGLFAVRPIKKGTPIVQYTGRLLDCWKKEDDAVENKYLFEVTKRWTIDGSVRENVARYINHGCRPNAESDVMPRKRMVVIRAIRNIRPGEEINYDYGTEYFEAYLKPRGCKCTACEAKRGKMSDSAFEKQPEKGAANCSERNLSLRPRRNEAQARK